MSIDARTRFPAELSLTAGLKIPKGRRQDIVYGRRNIWDVNDTGVDEMSANDELQLSVKNFETPDEEREIPKNKIKFIDIGGYRITKYEFAPGFRWTEHAKPVMGTELCEILHLIYQLSGRTGVKMKDGTEVEYGPGSLVLIPPGHDGWAVGDEPSVFLDFGSLLSAGLT